MLATSLNIIQYRYLSFESQLHVSIPKIGGGGGLKLPVFNCQDILSGTLVKVNAISFFCKIMHILMHFSV